MVTPLQDASLRLVWAKHQIGELEAAIKAHFAKNPYRIVQDRELKPGYVVYRAEPSAPIPDDWKRHVIRIVSDLREPLDYATVAVGKKFNAEKADFLVMPIEDSEATFEREMKKRKIETRCPELGGFLRALKPYKGPNDLIFYLHEVSRSQKHRQLATIAMRKGDITIDVDVLYFPTGGHTLFGEAVWSTTDDRLIVFELPDDAEFEGKIEAALHVSLSKLEGFEREPVTAVFMQMAEAVQNVLSQFERQFFSRT